MTITPRDARWIAELYLSSRANGFVAKGQTVRLPYDAFAYLVESVISWRLLDVQLERIADIALNPRETKIDEPGFDGEIQGRIEAPNLFYRYASGEPEMLQRVSFAIEPGVSR
jgi:ABC-type multidrug transport system fused ATPase/permease subunit